MKNFIDPILHLNVNHKTINMSDRNFKISFFVILISFCFYCKSYKLTEVSKTLKLDRQSKFNGIGVKSARMCEKYAENVFEEQEIISNSAHKIKEDMCGLVETPLIINGVDAGTREFPHMALIGYGNRRDKPFPYACGGSLISEKYILSAAHCTETKLGIPKWALLGELELLTDEDEADPILFRIVQRINHPFYNKKKIYNDIALYKLDSEVQFSPYIRPACLNVDFNLKKNPVLASGWGNTEYLGSGSVHLKKTQLSVNGVNECKEKYKNVVKFEISQGIDGDTMICAGGTTDKNDTCQGDSGGPLQYVLSKPYCMYSIVGVTSYGMKCGYIYPGIYTKVAHYIGWIESIVWP